MGKQFQATYILPHITQRSCTMMTSSILELMLNSDHCCLTKFLITIGACYVLKFFYNIIRNIVVTFLGLLFPVNLKNYGGEWALITGPTDGIGKEYAKNFAKRGMNVFLVARNAFKLASTAEELKKLNPNVRTHCLCIDFSCRTDEIYEKLAAELASTGHKIGILVNNVGIGYPAPARVGEIDDGELVIDDLCNVNMRAQVKVTRCVLPQMVARKNGLIINISSLSGIITVPYGAVYGAAKGFNHIFSDGLRYEYQEFGIKVQTVLPSWICTKLINGLAKPSWRVPTVDTFVRHSFSTIGWQDWTHGYWSHNFQGWLTTLFPSKTAIGMMKAGKAKRASYVKSK